MKGLVQTSGSFQVEGRKGMSVNVEDCPDRGMAESPCHHQGMLALFDQEDALGVS